MKRLFLFLAMALSSSLLLSAQNDCMGFFPNKEGSILVSKTYNVKDMFLHSTTYKVEQVQDFASKLNMFVNFEMKDVYGNVFNSGKIEAFCNDGVFSLQMVNHALVPQITALLSQNTEIVGSFLDYPNFFASYPIDKNFNMDGGSFVIRNKSDKKEFTKVTVSNRKYVKSETIETPAGTFETAKVTFDFEVNSDGLVTKYSGVEWIANGTGVVRSETLDDKNQLETYTLLTEIK